MVRIVAMMPFQRNHLSRHDRRLPIFGPGAHAARAMHAAVARRFVAWLRARARDP